ncbi:IS110 family transposase [Pseudomonas corrugata]
MNKVAIVAIDLGKLTFHVHEQDDHGHPLLRKKFKRVELLQHLANLEPCIVVMEACGGAHFMAQEVAKLGHSPKLIAPHLVRPYVKSNKNDFADAEAICEAASRPTMRFVPVKNQTQQALAMLNSVRDSLIKDRTATVNRIHAAFLEVGISLTPGYKSLKDIPALLEASSFHGLIRKLVADLYEHYLYLNLRIKVLDKEVDCQAAEVGDGKQFKCGRDYSASIGLVPKQHSTGGRTVLLGISKRGDRNQRHLFVQCAQTYVNRLDRQEGKLADWARKLLASHRHCNLVVCALANKFARIAWSIAANHTVFDAGPSAMNA